MRHKSNRTPGIDVPKHSSQILLQEKQKIKPPFSII